MGSKLAVEVAEVERYGRMFDVVRSKERPVESSVIAYAVFENLVTILQGPRHAVI